MTRAATKTETTERDAAMGALRRWVTATGRTLPPDALRVEIRTAWNHLWVHLESADEDELVALAEELGPHPVTFVQQREYREAYALIHERGPRMSARDLETALESFPSLTLNDLDFLRALANEIRATGIAK